MSGVQGAGTRGSASPQRQSLAEQRARRPCAARPRDYRWTTIDQTNTHSTFQPTTSQSPNPFDELHMTLQLTSRNFSSLYTPSDQHILLRF